MSAELKIHQDILGKVADAYSRSVHLAGQELAKQLDVEAPRDTGRLANSMTAIPTGRFNTTVGSDVIYALPVMDKVVRHPGSSGKPPEGTEDNPYAERAIKNTRGRIEDIISFALNSVGL